MKWAGGLLAVVLVAGLVMSAHDDSCVETAFSGGVKDSDCGPFPCSAYLRDEKDPKRDDYLLELSHCEIARLGAMIRAWDEQELDRELEEARAENTALQARLEEIALHEARVVSAETPARSAQTSAETVARADR